VKKERHPHHRLRARRRTLARAVCGAGRARGLPAALSPHPDDHAGRRHLGALPLAIGFGEGAELRRPLGMTIIGGLIASQLLTLITTPVVYVLLDKLRRRSPHERELAHNIQPPAAPQSA
jgi:hypothetical protein